MTAIAEGSDNVLSITGYLYCTGAMFMFLQEAPYFSQIYSLKPEPEGRCPYYADSD